MLRQYSSSSLDLNLLWDTTENTEVPDFPSYSGYSLHPWPWDTWPERQFLSAKWPLIRKKGDNQNVSWVVKTEAGRVKRPVIGPQISKDSVTGLTISCIHECIPLFFLYLNRRMWTFSLHHLFTDSTELHHTDCSHFLNIGIFVFQALLKRFREIFSNLVHLDARFKSQDLDFHKSDAWCSRLDDSWHSSSNRGTKSSLLQVVSLHTLRLERES